MHIHGVFPSYSLHLLSYVFQEGVILLIHSEEVV